MDCKCGCGKPVGRRSEYGYTGSHYKRSEESREKQRLMYSGENNPFFGKKHSQETKEKLSKALKGNRHFGRIVSEATREKMSQVMKGRPSLNKGKKWPPEYGAKISAAKKGRLIAKSDKTRGKWSRFTHPMKGKHHNDETKLKMSKSKADLIVSGCFRPYNENSGEFISKKNGKELHYRSKYEAKAFIFLEVMSSVSKYEVEPFSITYTYQGLQRRYIPDILVTYTNGLQELVEVKPASKVGEPVNVAKRIAAEEFCKNHNMKYSIWTQKQLKAGFGLPSDKIESVSQLAEILILLRGATDQGKSSARKLFEEAVSILSGKALVVPA